jgi:WD40 repeat protein
VDTNDLYDIAWSPDGRFIAVWESFLHFKMYIYKPDGRLAGSYSAYDEGLGIKKVTWSPSGQFLAIGSFDEQVFLLSAS